MLAAEEGRWIAITMPDSNDGGALSAQTGNPGILDILVTMCVGV